MLEKVRLEVSLGGCARARLIHAVNRRRQTPWTPLSLQLRSLGSQSLDCLRKGEIDFSHSRAIASHPPFVNGVVGVRIRPSKSSTTTAQQVLLELSCLKLRALTSFTGRPTTCHIRMPADDSISVRRFTGV
jgi:hypothetical protein